MSIKNGTTLTPEALKWLCSVINQTVNLPNNTINDISIQSTTSYSSLHIDKLLRQLQTDCEDYTNDVVSALQKLVAERVDFEPTIDNTTDKINTILLYSANNDNVYTQYLRLSDELVNLGDTSISLDLYMEKVEALATFVKQTDFDILKTEVANIKTDIGTTDISNIGDGTIKGSIDNLNSNLGKKVDKTDIVDTINSTSTDKQIPSAKAVHDNMLKFGSNTNVYTLDEQVVGEWIDGKTIYRRCIVNNGSFSDRQTVLSVDLSNVDRIIDYHGTAVANSTYELTMHYGHTKSCFDIYRDANDNKLRIMSWLTDMTVPITKVFIFMDYTKKTE